MYYLQQQVELFRDQNILNLGKIRIETIFLHCPQSNESRAVTRFLTSKSNNKFFNITPYRFEILFFSLQKKNNSIANPSPFHPLLSSTIKYKSRNRNNSTKSSKILSYDDEWNEESTVIPISIEERNTFISFFPFFFLNARKRNNENSQLHAF